MTQEILILWQMICETVNDNEIFERYALCHKQYAAYIKNK